MESDNLICDICSYEYNRKKNLPLKLIPCGHKFCKKCVYDWFVINKKKHVPFVEAL